MNKVMLVSGLTALLLLDGCASTPTADKSQPREEAAAPYKPATTYRNAEHLTIDRPTGLVIVDVTEFSNQCFKVRSAQAQRKSASNFSARVELARPGLTVLSVQEKSGDPDAVPVLMAEVRAAGNGMTQLDIYHTARSRMANALKEWAEGNKGTCPP